MNCFKVRIFFNLLQLLPLPLPLLLLLLLWLAVALLGAELVIVAVDFWLQTEWFMRPPTADADARRSSPIDAESKCDADDEETLCDE